MSSSSTIRLVWFDTEYSTLDLEDAHLLQVAMIVTDSHGRRVAPPADDVLTPIQLPPNVPVSDFVTAECPELLVGARARTAPSVEQVDALLSSRLDSLVGPAAAKVKDRPVLAGNTIHADWWLARRYLPRFISRLHYRQLDVSSLKLLWLDSRLGPEFNKDDTGLVREYLPGWTLPAQAVRHDALYDVMCSIAEMNYYRRHFLRA